MKPTRTPEQQKGASMKQLLCDPYILVAAGALPIFTPKTIDISIN